MDKIEIGTNLIKLFFKENVLIHQVKEDRKGRSKPNLGSPLIS